MNYHKTIAAVHIPNRAQIHWIQNDIIVGWSIVRIHRLREHAILTIQLVRLVDDFQQVFLQVWVNPSVVDAHIQHRSLGRRLVMSSRSMIRLWSDHLLLGLPVIGG